MTSPVILVVGAGPGLGAAVARRFGREGYDVALIARDATKLHELGTALQDEGIRAGWADADITDPLAFAAAVARLGEHTGRIDVLHFNPSAFRQKDPLGLSPEEMLSDLRLGVTSLLTALQAARPFLLAGARVTATGSMAADQPWHEAASLGAQKAALRNLIRSIDTTLAPDGIRAASLTVNGTLAPGTPFAPERVADALFALATTSDGDWRAEVPFDG